MTVEFKLFGHEAIIGSDGVKRWKDTLLSVEGKERKCPSCGEFPTESGHDPCIANLPGVEFACCGHGVDKPYVIYNNKRFEFETIEELKDGGSGGK